MPRRLKILMSAYACEPGKGSEPGVGWNWAIQMSRWHDVWVLTRANNRPSIEAEPGLADHPSLRWVYHDLPRWASFWKRGGRGIQAYYFLWQVAARKIGRRLHQRFEFDLLHHVTFGKYWVPSYLSFLPIRAVLGPLGGGESTPVALASTLSARGRWFEKKRDLVRGLANRDPLLRASFRRARAVAATTAETREVLGSLGASNVLIEPQCGVTGPELEFFNRLPVPQTGPFRVLSIGRALHWKGFHLGLQAFARFQRLCPEAEYWLVTSGPEAADLKQLATVLGVADRVVFWGRLPALSDVYEKLAQSHVLVHPALHEAFGNVCLEALAAGRPVLCLEAGGPALQVTDACGFRAPVSSVEDAVNGLAEAMTLLYRNPELRQRMSAAARDRVRQEFLWSRKAERMNALYQSLTCSEDDANSSSAPARS